MQLQALTLHFPASSFNPAAYATAAQGAKADAALPSEDFTDTNVLNLLSETLETEFNIGPSLNIEKLNVRIGNEVSNGKMFLSVAIGNLAAELLDSVSTNTQNIFFGLQNRASSTNKPRNIYRVRGQEQVHQEFQKLQEYTRRGSHTAQIGNDNLDKHILRTGNRGQPSLTYQIDVSRKRLKTPTLIYAMRISNFCPCTDLNTRIS